MNPIQVKRLRCLMKKKHLHHKYKGPVLDIKKQILFIGGLVLGAVAYFGFIATNGMTRLEHYSVTCAEPIDYALSLNVTFPKPGQTAQAQTGEGVFNVTLNENDFAGLSFDAGASQYFIDFEKQTVWTISQSNSLKPLKCVFKKFKM